MVVVSWSGSGVDSMACIHPATLILRGGILLSPYLLWGVITMGWVRQWGVYMVLTRIIATHRIIVIGMAVVWLEVLY